MSRKRPARLGKPDRRPQKQMPGPAIAAIEEHLYALLTPESFKPVKEAGGEKKLRERLWNLPVMMAIVLSLVYRRLPSLSEAVRLLEIEGLLWSQRLKVSKQALSKRLSSLPPELFHQIFSSTMAALAKSNQSRAVPNQWASSAEKFTAWWIADGSTLEILKKRLKEDEPGGEKLGGKMMMVVEAFHHTPVAVEYTQESRASDQSWMENLLEKLPVGGLLIFDLGFFNFKWFENFSEERKYFVTRLKSKTAYKAQRVLSEGSHDRDTIIKRGLYR